MTLKYCWQSEVFKNNDWKNNLKPTKNLKVLELNFQQFNESLNKHYRRILDNIKHAFIVFKKSNKLILSKDVYYHQYCSMYKYKAH